MQLIKYIERIGYNLQLWWPKKWFGKPRRELSEMRAEDARRHDLRVVYLIQGVQTKLEHTGGKINFFCPTRIFALKFKFYEIYLNFRA